MEVLLETTVASFQLLTCSRVSVPFVFGRHSCICETAFGFRRQLLFLDYCESGVQCEVTADYVSDI